MAKDLGKVEQSPADDRSYRALELENGMQASAKGLGAGDVCSAGGHNCGRVMCSRGAKRAGTFYKDPL